MTPLILCKGSHAWTSACAAHPTHLTPRDVLAPKVQMESELPSDREDITIMWDFLSGKGTLNLPFSNLY